MHESFPPIKVQPYILLYCRLYVAPFRHLHFSLPSCPMALCLDLILWIGTVALHDEIFMEVSCKTQHARKVGKLWECCWGGIGMVGTRSLALDYCMI